MPYYLVTHTSIVDGETEVKAAEKVLANLLSDEVVKFVVKFDETTVNTVVIANPGKDPSRCAAATDDMPVVSQMDAVPEDNLANQEVKSLRQMPSSPGKTIVAGAALFVAGCLVRPILDLFY